MGYLSSTQRFVSRLRASNSAIPNSALHECAPPEMKFRLPIFFGGIRYLPHGMKTGSDQIKAGACTRHAGKKGPQRCPRPARTFRRTGQRNVQKPVLSGPIGVAEYQPQARQSAQFQGGLPTAKQLANALREALPSQNNHAQKPNQAKVWPLHATDSQK